MNAMTNKLEDDKKRMQGCIKIKSVRMYKIMNKRMNKLKNK